VFASSSFMNGVDCGTTSAIVGVIGVFMRRQFVLDKRTNKLLEEDGEVGRGDSRGQADSAPRSRQNVTGQER
jgi:hypothetical protein